MEIRTENARLRSTPSRWSAVWGDGENQATGPSEQRRRDWQPESGEHQNPMAPFHSSNTSDCSGAGLRLAPGRSRRWMRYLTPLPTYRKPGTVALAAATPFETQLAERCN